ncbi:MAG: hypothetical protein ACRCZ2_11555, partial [Fusobacteriaceae bacterium]
MTTMALVLPYFCLGLSYVFFRKKNIVSPFQISKNKILSICAGLSVCIMTFVSFIFAGYNFTVPLILQLDKMKLYYGGLLMFMLIGILIKFLSEISHKAKENKSNKN